MAADARRAPRNLAGLVREIKAKPFSQKLAAVNRAVNRNVAYVSDRANYRRLDVWAKPTDILKRGKGDCEDYAILKMAALNAAGIPLSSMSLVVASGSEPLALPCGADRFHHQGPLRARQSA